MGDKNADPVLDEIVRVLKDTYRCHTVIVYGSRARGLVTPTSDYDVVGIRKSGAKTRITRKKNGAYWDVLVYPEKALRKLGVQHFSWKNARVLYEKGDYGQRLLCRLNVHVKKPCKRQPDFEIRATKVWAQKQVDRIKAGGIQGLYRRAEFQAAWPGDYFFVRQKRYWGPKESFKWLERNDPGTFRLIRMSLKKPESLRAMMAATSRIYGVSLE